MRLHAVLSPMTCPAKTQVLVIEVDTFFYATTPSPSTHPWLDSRSSVCYNGGMDKATEFSRRRNLPDVEVRYMFAGRTADVVLTRLGKELGSKTEVTTRGKPTTTYHLPELS